MKKKLFIFIVVNALFSVPALAQEGLITINKSAEIERILALTKEMNKKKAGNLQQHPRSEVQK